MAYTSAQKKYFKFCTMYGLEPLPVTNNVILLYVAYLDTLGLSQSTISVYLSAVRSAQVMSGMAEPQLRSPQVKLALKAIKEKSGPPKQKAPIEYSLLKKLLQLIDTEPGHVMWYAIFSLAFFAGLRGAEYTAVTIAGVRKYPVLDQIQFTIVQGAPVLYYKVLQSKTQPHGYTVAMGCTGTKLCPYCCMYNYVQGRFAKVAQGNIPLFVYSNGTIVTKAHVNFMIKRLVAILRLDVSLYSTHSLRAGAASTAAALGFKDWEIMRLGGWRSAAYRSYIRQVDSHVAGLSARLATSQ